MFNFTDKNGLKVPFLKIAIPCWISAVLAFAMIGHTVYLEVNRPTVADPSQGFIIAQTVNRTTHYLSQIDRVINAGLWILLFTYMAGLLFYFWRLGILRQGHNPRSI